MSFWSYVVASALGFLACGAGIALVGYLFRELLGHWLAKELQKHGAAVETVEHRRRVAFEALHARRMSVAEDLSRVVTETMMLMAYPPELRGVGADTKDSYESRHFDHWKTLRVHGDNAVRTAISGLPLFETTRLIELTFAWVRELVAAVDPYHDAVVQVAAERDHWVLPDAQRIARLEDARARTLSHQNAGLASATQELTDHLRSVMTA